MKGNKTLHAGVAAALAIFFVAQGTTPQDTRRHDQTISHEKDNASSIQFLGSVDGRSYFAEANEIMVWKEAKTHCEDLQLEMVSIETLAQADFLKIKLYEHFQDSLFWTSAREDRTLNGFVWDMSGLKPNKTVTKDWINTLADEDHFQCGMVHSNWRNNEYALEMHIVTCDLEYYVLCQSLTLST